MKRLMVISVFLVLVTGLKAQDAEQPVTGVLEFGMGWGIPVDFMLENNIFTLDYLGQRLFSLPWYAGINASKSLSPVSRLETGVSYHRRSSSWIYHQAHNTPGGISFRTTNMVLALNCIDFLFRYYRFFDYWRNREVYIYGGIAPVWVINVPYSKDLNYNSVPDHCFRDWNLAVNGGLALERRNLRWKLQLDLCLIPVTNGDYAQKIPEDERAWGAAIFPLEALLSCAFLIR